MFRYTELSPIAQERALRLWIREEYGVEASLDEIEMIKADEVLRSNNQFNFFTKTGAIVPEETHD